MDEIQKLLPLFGFLGTICTAVVAALLCKSITEDLKLTSQDHNKDIQRLKLRMGNLETIIRITNPKDSVPNQILEDSQYE